MSNIPAVDDNSDRRHSKHSQRLPDLQLETEPSYENECKQVRRTAEEQEQRERHSTTNAQVSAYERGIHEQ